MKKKIKQINPDKLAYYYMMTSIKAVKNNYTNYMVGISVMITTMKWEWTEIREKIAYTGTNSQILWIYHWFCCLVALNHDTNSDSLVNFFFLFRLCVILNENVFMSRLRYFSPTNALTMLLFSFWLLLYGCACATYTFFGLLHAWAFHRNAYLLKLSSIHLFVFLTVHLSISTSGNK